MPKAWTKSRIHRLAGALLLLAVAGLVPGRVAAEGAALRLLMLDQTACEWCALWDAEVGQVYAKTAEGRRAPLQRSNIHKPLPEGVTLERRAHYTPTFVLLAEGREVGRIEGYPGEDFFYGLLQRLIEKAEAQLETGGET